MEREIIKLSSFYIHWFFELKTEKDELTRDMIQKRMNYLRRRIDELKSEVEVKQEWRRNFFRESWVQNCPSKSPSSSCSI